jgi:hypothetical protein
MIALCVLNFQSESDFAQLFSNAIGTEHFIFFCVHTLLSVVLLNFTIPEAR